MSGSGSGSGNSSPHPPLPRDFVDPLDYSPWSFWTEADESAQERQREAQRRLSARPGHELGEGCFVSELAALDNDELRLGDRTYIAAGAYLTGSLRTGADCSINPYTVVRGRVELGDGVRIGAHSSILGFNHSMSDPNVPVFRQPLTTKGIRVGHDVWVGSHVVILDGVTVGDRSVLAAGAVVTKDVPAGAIVGGNPAKHIRWRVPPADAAPGSEDLGSRLAAFADLARAQGVGILDRCWDADRRLFTDRPGAAPTVRAQADAIEVADLLLGMAPPQLPADEQVARLRGWQDAATGRVPRMLPDGSLADPAKLDDDSAYHVLSAGYALDLLGSGFPHPLTLVTESSAGELASFCDALPWETQAWRAGAWADALGTALLWSRRRGDTQPAGLREALFGWLVTHADPATGMFGRIAADGSRLQLVNGFYRASRGTFAQFAVPLPYPERVVDTVLAHAQDVRYFRPDRHDACNILDVAHPLWLTRGSGYRTAEVEQTARRLLDAALERWVAGEGFGFRARSNDDPSLTASIPGLQGTEMWLATIWYLADLLGVSEALGYRPRGVHRPEPAPLVCE
ncbi:acyltransferase [Leifsonia sp. NPDC058230]|uniref:acyltransferase n=1 Tax=Leifsonia sp. NPDC058230 TaxID=3346391 RepID=UPI0036DC8BB7